MNIKLLKLTKDFLNENFYFADFEILDIGVILKGIKYDCKKKYLSFPFVKTTAGIVYTPFMFSDQKYVKELFAKMKELILATPLPEKTEECDEELKIRAAERLAERKRRGELLDKMGRASPGRKDHKGFKPSFQNNGKKKSTVGVWTRPDPQTNHKAKVFNSLGSGFTEVNVPKRRN